MKISLFTQYYYLYYVLHNHMFYIERRTCDMRLL